MILFFLDLGSGYTGVFSLLKKKKSSGCICGISAGPLRGLYVNEKSLKVFFVCVFSVACYR